MDLVDGQVRSDLTCWASIDPETLVISGMVNGRDRIPTEYEPLLVKAEYSTDEPHRFAQLARRGEVVSGLGDLSERERARSTRLNTVWRPLGMDEELRVVFLANGQCWGAAGLVRAGLDFTPREVEFVAAVAPAVAAATRLAVRAQVSAATAGQAPAIVVTGRSGEVHSVTPQAREWQERLNDIAPGRFLLMMRVMAQGAMSAADGGFKARLRDARGSWCILQSSRLMGDEDERVAVLIESAAGDQLLGLLLTAYGLTARERDICREVMGGQSTAAIAERLFISPLTVQDHLKAIFAKVGVRSRGGLVATLRPVAPIPDGAEPPRVASSVSAEAADQG